MPKNRKTPNNPVTPKCDKMTPNDTETEKTEAAQLSHRQQTALPIIAAAPTIAQAARSAGISNATLHRWLNDPNFRTELTRQRQETAALARQEIQALTLRSISALSDALDDPNINIRLRAARYALTFAIRLNEVEKLQSEVQYLEEILVPLAESHPANKYQSR